MIPKVCSAENVQPNGENDFVTSTKRFVNVARIFVVTIPLATATTVIVAATIHVVVTIEIDTITLLVC